MSDRRLSHAEVYFDQQVADHPEEFEGFFDNYITEPHKIELKLDEEAAKKKRFLLSAIIEPKWPNYYQVQADNPAKNPLPLIARTAFRWMNDNWKCLIDEFAVRYPFEGLTYIRNKTPSTLCAMFADERIIICSSVVGFGSFVYMFERGVRDQQLIVQALRLAGEYDEEEEEQTEQSAESHISQVLNELEDDDRHVGHHHQANCAEALALHLWSVTNTKEEVTLNNFRLVTVTKKSDAIQLFAPCAPNGCEDLLHSMLVFDLKDLGSIDSMDNRALPRAELSDKIVTKHSITETAVGTLWLSCGARCKGTGKYNGAPCYCAHERQGYAFWCTNTESRFTWASSVEDVLTSRRRMASIPRY